VPLILLSKAVTDLYGVAPKLKLVFRNESSTGLVPNYEGEPLAVSLSNQIKASGARIDPNGDVLLLVNNFDGPSQKEAPNQAGDTPTSFSKFDSLICSGAKTIGFVDNKYSNGADLPFVDYVLERTKTCNVSLSNWAYAGWNTNGNTVGTVVANTAILHTVSTHRFILTDPASPQRACRYCSPC
jgi:hypothetical protein